MKSDTDNAQCFEKSKSGLYLQSVYGNIQRDKAIHLVLQNGLVFRICLI